MPEDAEGGRAAVVVEEAIAVEIAIAAAAVRAGKFTGSVR